MSLYKILAPLKACFADDLICNLLTLGLDLRNEKDVSRYCILGGREVVGGIESGSNCIATGCGAIETDCVTIETDCVTIEVSCNG